MQVRRSSKQKQDLIITHHIVPSGGSMRGSGSERATAVRGSLFPPFSPLFPFFLFSSMAKIGPISATNQNWVLFSEVGEAYLWCCTTQGRIGSGSQHSNAPVLFKGMLNMPRGGQRGAILGRYQNWPMLCDGQTMRKI